MATVAFYFFYLPVSRYIGIYNLLSERLLSE